MVTTPSQPLDSLRGLLLSRVQSRSSISFRISLAVLVCSLALASAGLWSAVSFSKRISTYALYGLFGAYLAIFITTTVYTLLNSRANAAVQSLGECNSVPARSWHKRGYKILIAVAIVEHCLFFVTLPVILFHSLGLSLSSCLFDGRCAGMDYNTWITISESDGVRVQELFWTPIIVKLSRAVKITFAAYLAALGMAIITTGMYMYAEAQRQRVPTPPKRRPSISLYVHRVRLVTCMGIASLIQLILSVVGITVIGDHWFAFSVILAAGSGYPLLLLKRNLSNDASITRFQLRKLAQICLCLLFMWLYCAGAGVSLSLISALPLSPAGQPGLVDAESVAMLIVLLVVHLIFSAISAAGIYVHLSITDVVQSLLRAKPDTTLKRQDTMEMESMRGDDMGSIKSIVEWGSRLCASCSTHSPNTVLVPCGHSVVCSDCCKVLLTIPGFRCPLCCVEVYDCAVKQTAQ